MTPIVDANPDFEEEMAAARLFAGIWKTEFTYHTVDFDEILSGGVGRDAGIPPIDNPNFVSVSEADEWLDPLEPVIALEIGGQARAYPIQILIWLSNNHRLHLTHHHRRRDQNPATR